ncbi:MAG: L,D-transpeptidase family protein, partial [Alphaproteobacteria bacterium]
LRRALARYRAIDKAGGWPAVPPIKGLAVGKSSPGVAALRRRLVVAGDLKADTASRRLFDSAAAAALGRFQARHGLAGSGFLDVLTLAALNVPAPARVASIALNLERLRWVPDEIARRAVIANAAGFDLRAVENGKTRFYSRIIVGTCYQKTPQFVARITGVRFNPYWRVPQSIANNEILPRLKRDPGYLRRKGIRVLSDWGGAVLDPRKIDWKKLKRMPYKLRQEPGRGNALGRIRLLMPNPHNVYLHDTPTKKLFERARRDFSHGCVRVARPVALAGYLLRGDPAWSLPAVKRAAASRRQRTVLLALPVPIYIGYFTAWVAEDGTVNFRNDIYRRDAPLRRALKRAAARRR